MENATITKLDYPCYPKAWQIDMMKGCDIGCIYCSLAIAGKADKVDISELLESDEPREGLYLSPNCDPFSKYARDNTHRVLEKYLPMDTGIVLITKRRIPKETIKLISQYPDSVVPNITLGRLDNEMNSYIEKNASSTEERLATIKDLSDAGIKVTVRMTPIFPEIDDEYEVLDQFMRTISEAGAYQVKVAYAVIRDALAFRPIIKKLTSHPRLEKAWSVMTEEIDIYKGKGNVPPLERRVKLYADTSELAQKYGMKSGACTVLDYSLLDMKEDEMEFNMCRSILANLDKSIKDTFVEQ